MQNGHQMGTALVGSGAAGGVGCTTLDVSGCMSTVRSSETLSELSPLLLDQWNQSGLPKQTLMVMLNQQLLWRKTSNGS